MEQDNPGAIEVAEIAKLFEASFIELALEMAQKNNLKKGQFASLIWPELNPLVARNRWGNMRLADSRTGKPTPCTLTDAYRIVKALGVNVAYLTLQAENLAEHKFKQMTQPGNDQPAARDAKSRRKQ